MEEYFDCSKYHDLSCVMNLASKFFIKAYRNNTQTN